MSDLLQSIMQAETHPPVSVPPAAAGSDSANSPVLGLDEARTASAPFVPTEPNTLEESGLTETTVEALVLKYLLANGDARGRQMAKHIRLSFGLLQDELMRMKMELLIGYKGNADMGDYLYELSTKGVEKARRYVEQSTYFGTAPVQLGDYIDSVQQQSVKGSSPKLEDMKRSLSDMVISDGVLSQIGQAMNEGRGMFLYGDPGNGKTCMAERLISCCDPYVWIPRTLIVTGDIIRLYDPACHEEAPLDEEDGLIETTKYDRRWIRIKRPTVVVGGELTMQQLDFAISGPGIVEAPVQLKSNGGALLIDDFGRQQISTSELLNRWIIPLEKGFDHLALPNGRQLQVPFEQVIIFSTNLDPAELVDEAFLRRIPYKIKVADPTEAQFRVLFTGLAHQRGIECPPQAVDYLLEKHFKPTGRPMRFCHPRDILRQVKNYCEFHDIPLAVTPQNIDEAVNNYFSGLDVTTSM